MKSSAASTQRARALLFLALTFACPRAGATHARAQGSQVPQPRAETQAGKPMSKKEADSEAKRLFQQGKKLYEQGKHVEAAMLFDRALTLSETALGLDRPTYVNVMLDLALVHMAKGDHITAGQRLRRALDICEAEFGPEHLLTAGALHAFGLYYGELGDFIRAEQSYRRSLEIREKALGPNHRLVGVSLINLGAIRNEQGDFAAEERMLQRALGIIEKESGPEHEETATVLGNLGALYLETNKLDRAEQSFDRSLKILEKLFGPHDIRIAPTLNNRALVYSIKGDDARAEPMYWRVVDIYEKSGGAKFSDLSFPLDNLAGIYWKRGDFTRAEPLLQRSLEITLTAYGDKHNKVGTVFNDFARMYEFKGDVEKAVAAQKSANDIAEHNLAYLLTAGSESQKRLLLMEYAKGNDFTISLHVRSAPSNVEAARLALTTILRRKGRGLDVMSAHVSTLRRRLTPRDAALLDELSRVRAQLAAAVLKGAGQGDAAAHREKVARLEEESGRLEARVSESSTEFRVQTQPVTLESVQHAIPAGAALIELILYRPYDSRAKTQDTYFGPERYVAYVLTASGEPAFADLGEAAPVNRAAARLRAALGKPQSADYKQAARALDELVMRPVRGLLGETRTVLLSPDGELNLVPFAALLDERGRYLLEDYTFTYLTSGRDLLRLGAPSAQRQQPLVVANPTFDLADAGGGQKAQGADAGSGRRSLDFNTLPISPLPGTAEEAAAIKRIVPSALLLTEGAATEAALKGVAGPRLLHIATHGFFLKDQPPRSVAASRQLVLDETPREAWAENPLLRSGLLLAGVKKGQSGEGEDGVLTALEVAGMDLWGTKLVVLSACETGVGDVANGDGVYGLRRALVLAGAESQLMSLWQVSDTATRDLMVEYYRRIERGEGRMAALRAAQLGMLRGRTGEQPADARQLVLKEVAAGKAADYSHPYYWASFIPVGDWRGINQTTTPTFVESLPPAVAASPRQPAAVAPRRPAVPATPVETTKPLWRVPDKRAMSSATVPVEATRPSVRERRAAPPRGAKTGRASTTRAERDFDEQMRAASGFVRLRNFREAVPHLERALALRPDDFAALAMMADAKYALADFPSAASFYERALALRPGDSGLRALLGDTYFRRTPPDYDRAIEEYRKVLASDSKNERAWEGIASAALRKGNGLVALDAIRQLTALNASHPALPRLRAELEALRPTAAPPRRNR